MCCFPVFMCCQVEGWCQKHKIMSFVLAKGSMFPNVNMNLGCCGSLMWIGVHMVYKI
jgi:hypothetical protein